jgi:phosphoserine phosphatase
MSSAQRVSVVIPALNEASHIAAVVAHALADPVTAEVIVVDDSSIDDTAALARAAGARVLRSSMLGKGASMHDGARAAACPIVVYLDGDLDGLRPGIVGDLTAPIAHDRADFVKARFGRSGGRVTELTAKPMLRVFFPELASFSQPLGGIVAARRELLRSLRFEDGYGVDIGLLIDAQRAGARLAEVDIGSLINDSQPLLDLSAMANEVARVIYSRARAAGRLTVDQIVAMYETQRQATAELDYVLTRRRGRRKLLLLDLEGTVTPCCYAREVARATGREGELDRLLERGERDRCSAVDVAALFRFVHQREFERVAQDLPLRPGVVEAVHAFRRDGFMVGLLSDSWFVGTEIVRRRLFADFAVAHTLHFEGEVCSGRLRLNPAYLPAADASDGDRSTAVCKSRVLQRFRQDPAPPPIESCWAIGDHPDDLALLRAADRAFVIGPMAHELARASGASAIDGFDALPIPGS